MNTSISPYEIYTDGSMKTDGVDYTRGDGGWSFVIVRDSKILYEADGSEEDTTNQRMELTAAVQALNYIKNQKNLGEEVVLYSDSAYLINCYLKEWYKTWLTNGWVNSKKEPVANRDLWAKLIPFFKKPRYSFQKVKGHADNYYNNFCDRHAQEAAERCKKEHDKRKREEYYSSL